MCSVHLDPRFPKGNYYCSYRLASGQRTYRSTGTKDKENAGVICEGWQAAETSAQNGKISQERVSEILVNTLTRTGAKYAPLVPISTILAEVCVLPESGFFTYLIQSGDFVKIGKTTRLRSRMGTYRAHNPTYRLLAVRSFKSIEQSSGFETDMHKEFSEL